MPGLKTTRSEHAQWLRAEHDAELAQALRGAMFVARRHRRFSDAMEAQYRARMERERLAALELPQFDVALQLPTIPERKPAGREENASEVAA